MFFTAGWGFTEEARDTTSVEITEEEHVALVTGMVEGKAIVVGSDGKPTLEEPPAEPLASVQARLCDDVDRQAQAFRDKYMTPGGAQAATYLFKQAQAQAALAAQATTDAGKTPTQLATLYPYIANEIGITVDPVSGQPATDLYGVARAVMATVQAWQPLNLAVEAMRLKTKAAITAATTEAAAKAAHEAAAWPAAA